MQVRAVLLLLPSIACAPLMSAALPVPLPTDRPTAASIGIAAPTPVIRPNVPDGVPAPPIAQVSAAGTVRLAERWEAGPLFLLDLRPEGRELASGLFVRHWVSDPADEIAVGLRFDVGWAWLQGSTDVRVRASDEIELALSPGVLTTPHFAVGRLPATAVLRLGRVDLAVELGVSAGFVGPRTRALAHGGARAQVAF